MTAETRVRDVLDALNLITGGRMVVTVADYTTGRNRYLVTKSSGVPGKGLLEIPGLIWGDPDAPVRRLAVAMTMTEQAVELAGATGVDLIIAHHPIADAASSGGVPLSTYLPLYGIACIEVHEPLHGLHPGIAWLHGHRPHFVSTEYGGIPGNVVYVGRPLAEVQTLGELVSRLNRLIGRDEEAAVLAAERQARGGGPLQETVVATLPAILAGSESAPVAEILHIHPHTGFRTQHLLQALAEYPLVDTVVASISRLYPGDEMVATATRLGLNFVTGNSHAVEILENGLPLAYALQELLPGVDVQVFRERMTSAPVGSVGGAEIRSYAQTMSQEYLLRHRAETAPVGGELQNKPIRRDQSC